MDLAGSNYLLTLAVISITFVAFSTIVVVFRESQGAVLLEYDIVILRMFVVSGLEATIFSLIPPLLALFDLTPIWIWRVSSLAFALVMIWRGIYFWHRQSRFERRRRNDILFAIYAIAIFGLIINAMGIFFEPGVAIYALAATWLLVNAILVFILALNRFLHSPEKT